MNSVGHYDSHVSNAKLHCPRPIDWDGFGLPAEQYSNQTQKNSAEFTLFNIHRFRNQILKFGFLYDFDYEISAIDPDYFRWTQLIFLWIFEDRLAQLKIQKLNYCPELGVFLADKEVKLVNQILVSRWGERPVLIQNNEQWVIKITQYAHQLLAGFKRLDWPITTKKLQTNSIGLQKGFDVACDFNYCYRYSTASSVRIYSKTWWFKVGDFYRLGSWSSVTENGVQTAIRFFSNPVYCKIPKHNWTNPQLTPPLGIKLELTAIQP